MQGVPTTVLVSSAFLKQCMNDPEKAKYLEEYVYNVQAIKNLMKQYNSNGEYVNPVNGLTGLEATDATGDSYKKMIDIPESSLDEMFEQTKKSKERGVSHEV